MRTQAFTRIAAALAFGTISVSASAAPTTFFGEDLGLGEGTRLAAHPNADAARASFLGNLTGVGTEDFEGHSGGAPLAVTFPGSTGNITATINGSGGISTIPSGTNGVGRYPISGSNYWEGTDQFSIAFSAPIAAFGFYGVDIGDFGGRVTLTLVGGTTTTVTVPNTVNGRGGGVLYFGYIDEDNPFTSVTFGNTAAGTDFFGFDDFTIGDTQQVCRENCEVPEPGTLALLAGGLLGLLGLRRRIG